MGDTLQPPTQDAVSLQAATTSSSSSDRPSAHQAKYDRQLRLWGATGQQGLQSARILCVGANGTATQALKNLVLPGIGHFSLLSPTTSTTPSDLGANFFLSSSSLGKPLAPEAVSLLLELNSDVSGEAITAPVESLTADQIAQFSLVIAVDVDDPKERNRISDACWERGVPFIGVRSVGFYGEVRTQVEEICIIETHPESLVDLRIQHPFPALLDYAHSIDYATLDSEQHGHVPAVVILVKGLEAWKAAHNGNPPTGTAERKQFIDEGILAHKRHADEENFDEAVTLYRRAGTKPNVPPELEALFNDSACENISAQSSAFWLLLHSLRAFVRSPSNPSSLLPLSGALPDMKSSSTSYIALQTLYKSKAAADRDAVRALLAETCDRAGVDAGRRQEAEGELESFVKHAAWVRVLRGSRAARDVGEMGVKGQFGALLSAASFQSPPDLSLHIRAALLASDAFFLTHSRVPGSSSTAQELEQDATELERLAKGVFGAWAGGEDLGVYGVEREEVEEALGKVCREVVRAPPSTTLPQTSSLLGGLVAQEAIKLVTRQYVPLGRVVAPSGRFTGGETVVWDGVRSGSGVVDA
ncbi:hypothetical protein JCM10207_001355 [Rhodosporidiobolus poonsookiae]